MVAERANGGEVQGPKDVSVFCSLPLSENIGSESECSDGDINPCIGLSQLGLAHVAEGSGVGSNTEDQRGSDTISFLV
jgi:hypothetical protein